MKPETQPIVPSNSNNKFENVSCKEMLLIEDDVNYKQLQLKEKSLELSNFEENFLLNRKLTELMVKKHRNW